MRVLFSFIFFLIQCRIGLTQRECGSSTNEACENVQPCFDTANAPTLTCFQSCSNDDDCSSGEACRTTRVCGAVTALTCTFGCDLCEDDGQDFICLCYRTCPDVEEFGVPVVCGDSTRQQCIGAEYGHPDIQSAASDNPIITTDSTASTNSAPCLSAYGEVRVLNKGYTYLKDLEKGDKVLVSESDNDDSSLDEYQEVYGFGHRDVYAVATFLQLTTAGNQGESPLELTGEHLVMKRNSLTGNGIPVRADSVKVGDFLIGSRGVAEMVIQISSVTRSGLYTPITKDGKMLVNGVQVPAYTAVQDQHPESFVVGNWETISHYLMSHASISPFRIMCSAGGLTHFCEQQNANGQLLFVNHGESLISWIMNQAVEVQIIMLPPAFLVMMYFYSMEQLFGGFSMMYVFPLTCFLFSGIMSISYMQKKKLCAKI